MFGLERGYCLMIGGPDAAVERLTPIFETLAPGIGDTERTPGRTDAEASEEHGWLHCGPSGAGHFVKMVHNGIEYGLMAAYAEGLNVLAKADIGAIDHAVDAETAPLDAAQYYRYDLDLAQHHRGVAPRVGDEFVAARPHRRGVPRRPGAERLRRRGERLGRRSLDHQRRDRRRRAGARAVGGAVPAVQSRGRSDVADQVLSAMRAGFGGHVETKDTTR